MLRLKSDRIRLSAGTAVALGLLKGTIDNRVEIRTLYLMLNHACMGSCAFCSGARETLSWMKWPEFGLSEVLEHMASYGKAERICIQCPIYPHMVDDLLEFLKNIDLEVPISVSIPPLPSKNLERVAPLVERIGIALDCADEGIFEEVKSYPFDKTIRSIRNAVRIKGGATSHLIVGLGESDLSLYDAMCLLMSIKAYPALFAFTPLPGTRLSSRGRPPVERYRAIQALHFLLTNGIDPKPRFRKGKLVYLNVDGVERAAFMTSGCPSCNRPFYNERPLGPLYNYPWELNNSEFERCLQETFRYLKR